MSKFSKIVLVAPNNIALRYNLNDFLVELHQYEPIDANVPQVFNQALDQYQNEECILCLLGPEVILNPNYPQALEIIVSTFEEQDSIRCIYTDNITISNGIKYPLFFPAYKFDVCDSVTINTSVFCHSKIKGRFDETLKYLYEFAFLDYVFRNNLAWHIAEPLVIVTDKPHTQLAQQELQKLKNDQ